MIAGIGAEGVSVPHGAPHLAGAARKQHMGDEVCHGLASQFGVRRFFMGSL